MHHLQSHPPLGDHPGGHRAVDAAGQQGDRPAVDAHGQAARPGLGLGVDIGGVVPDLDVDRQLRVVDVHLQVVVGLVELAAHILAELDGGHGEGFIRPLGLYLKMSWRSEAGRPESPGRRPEWRPCPSHRGGPGKAPRCRTPWSGPRRRPARRSCRPWAPLGGGLPGIHPELAVGVEAAVDVGL